jgi:eukaryotic translation initiation factor 2C
MREKDEGFRMLKNFLKGVFILVDMYSNKIPAANSRKKKILDIISYFALEEYTFIKEDERTTVKVYYSVRLYCCLNSTAQDYFRRTYNKDISTSPFGVVTGNKDRPAIIPAEFCWVVPGQFYKKKIPARYTDDVVRFATKSPRDRLQTIMGGIGHDTMMHRLSAPVGAFCSDLRFNF